MIYVFYIRTWWSVQLRNAQTHLCLIKEGKPIEVDFMYLSVTLIELFWTKFRFV